MSAKQPPLSPATATAEAAKKAAEASREAAVKTAAAASVARAAEDAAKTAEQAVEAASQVAKLAVSEEKKQLKLFLDNSMFHAIFDTINDGILVADAKGEFLFSNRAALQIIGIDSLVNDNLASLEKYFFKLDKVTPWPIGEDPLARALHGKTTINEFMFIKNKETTAAAKAGVDSLVSCMAVPLTYGVNGVDIAGGLIMFRKIQQIADTEVNKP